MAVDKAGELPRIMTVAMKGLSPGKRHSGAFTALIRREIRIENVAPFKAAIHSCIKSQRGTAEKICQ
jgi:hypothetical protein